jgi:Spy/CpxP family protein refolding chaperone
MKLKRNRLIIGAVLLSLGLFAGCGLHRHHPCRGRDVSKHVLKRLDRGAKKLNLTDVQKEKYDEFRLKIEAHLKAMKTERDRFLGEMKAQLTQEDPDIDAVVERVKMHFRALPEKMEEPLDLFAEFYKVLDDDQKAKMMKHVREKMKKHEAS